MSVSNYHVLCIYHGNCADGFAAAVVVGWAIKNVEFHAGVHQKPPPDVTGKDVILVDFSYKRPVLLEMAQQAENILILDHHKSAKEELIDLPGNVTTVFDMNRSGARITWDYYNGPEEPPMLIRHIEDRDLWRFNLEGTREIQAALFSYPYEFALWGELLLSDPKKLRADGIAIERKHSKDIREFIGVAAYTMNIAGHDVPVLNVPYFYASDAGHIMAEGKPFAACYWDTLDERVFSLRSRDDGIDVSLIAKQFGGGGHPHAAGFKVMLFSKNDLNVNLKEIG